MGLLDIAKPPVSHGLNPMIVRQSEALALSFSLRPPSSGARRPYRASGLVLGRTTGFRRREGTPRLRPKQALIEAPAKRREGWTPGLQASPGEQRESTRSGPSPIGSPRNSNCEKFTNASERGSQFPFASTRKSARAGAVSLARRRTFSVPARALERLDDDHPAAATRASARRQRCFGLAVGLGALALRRRRGGGERLADAFDVAGSNRAAVMADAVEAAGQHVQEKAADELGGVEGHSPDPVAAFDPVVLPFEGDAGLAERDQPRVRDSDPVGIACEISENRFRSGEGSLGVDDPCDRKSSGEEN